MVPLTWQTDVQKRREITVWTTHCIVSESFHKPSLTSHKKSWFFDLIRDQDSERNPASFHSAIPRSSRLSPGRNSMFSRHNLSCSSTRYRTQKSSRETSGIVNDPEVIAAGVWAGAASRGPGTVVGTAGRSLLAIIACCCCNMLSIISSIMLAEVEGGAATGAGRATTGVTIAGVGASACAFLEGVIQAALSKCFDSGGWSSVAWLRP